MQMSDRPTTAARPPSCAVCALAWPAGQVCDWTTRCLPASVLQDDLETCYLPQHAQKRSQHGDQMDVWN